jgi:DNA polymerase V
MYALVDCNNFYASCERVFQPHLQNRPVIVLSNNDGCVVARSNEAKELGIGMAVPYYQVKELAEAAGVQVFSSNYALYADMSARVMTTLSQFTPGVEVYSIDEAFLDLGSLPVQDLEEYARHIRRTVMQWTGIPVTIGVAPTKTLAKIANRTAKNRKLEDGVLVLSDTIGIERALKEIPVEDVWGVGWKYARRLQRLGIHTAFDLSLRTDAWVRKEMTVVGLRLVHELKGISCLPVEYVMPAKQSICTSRSFGKPVHLHEELKEAVITYVTKCAEKLRRQGSCASLVTVFLQTNRFKDTRQYANSHTLSLPVASSDTLELIRYALRCMEIIHRQGILYNKAGVIVSGLVPEAEVQGAVFDDPALRERASRLMKVIDSINARMGSSDVKVKTAGQGLKEPEWGMKRAMLSACYTTRWKDILTVHL